VFSAKRRKEGIAKTSETAYQPGDIFSQYHLLTLIIERRKGMKKVLIVFLLAIAIVSSFTGISQAQTLPPDQPVISLSTGTAPLFFGQVTMSSSVTRTVLVQNTGTADLLVSALDLSAGTSAEYTWSPAAPFTVVAGGSATLSVTYSPVDTSLDNGSLTISSNDPLRPTLYLFLSGSGIGAAAPVISLSTSTVGFGQVAVGSSVTTTAVLVRNTGNADLIVSSVDRCAGTSMEYTWTPTTPFSIAPGGFSLLSVTYSPIDTVTDLGCLTIASSDPVRPSVRLALSGSGSANSTPVISLSTGTAPVFFGQVTVNSSLTRTIVVRNTGNADLNITSLDRSVGTSAEYTWSPASPFTIAPGGSTTLFVTYTPVDTTTDNGSLTITSNDPVRPTLFLFLSGSGMGNSVPVISLSTPTVSFIQVPVYSSATTSVLITNTGNADLNVSSVGRCAGTSTEYAWSPAAPFTLVPGGSAALLITYSPTDTIADFGCLTITSNDPAKPAVSIGLAGIPAATAAPVISLGTGTAQLLFGQVTVYSSVTRTVLVMNTGSADLNVSSIGSCVGTSTEYTWSPDAPLTIVPGGSATLFVTYSPIDESTDNGCLEIASNDTVHPKVDLFLSGSGLAPQPQLIDIDITGFAVVGRVSIAKGKPIMPSLTVQNPGSFSSGIDRVTARLEGVENNVTVYSQTIALDNIAAGATVSVNFPSYNPVTVGTITWTVIVADDDPDSDTVTASTKVVK
jgi:ASPM-SPD-2-Hydin domain-containing protein